MLYKISFKIYCDLKYIVNCCFLRYILNLIGIKEREKQFRGKIIITMLIKINENCSDILEQMFGHRLYRLDRPV